MSISSMQFSSDEEDKLDDVNEDKRYQPTNAFQCEHCSNRCKTQKELNEHFITCKKKKKNIENQEIFEKCKYCNCGFTKERYWKNHLNSPKHKQFEKVQIPFEEKIELLKNENYTLKSQIDSLKQEKARRK
jgi:hypothetical protein